MSGLTEPLLTIRPRAPSGLMARGGGPSGAGAGGVTHRTGRPPAGLVGYFASYTPVLAEELGHFMCNCSSRQAA